MIVGCRRTVLGGAGCPGSGSRRRCGPRFSRCGSWPRCRRSISPSTALPDDDLGVVALVRVTHPFHPLFGRDLEFVKRRRNWRADRVYVFDPHGLLLSLPVEWTDVAGEDPFVLVAAGRSPFHPAGLLELADLVARLRAVRSLDDTAGVHRIMP